MEFVLVEESHYVLSEDEETPSVVWEQIGTVIFQKIAPKMQNPLLEIIYSCFWMVSKHHMEDVMVFTTAEIVRVNVPFICRQERDWRTDLKFP